MRIGLGLRSDGLRKKIIYALRQSVKRARKKFKDHWYCMKLAVFGCNGQVGKSSPSFVFSLKYIVFWLWLSDHQEIS